MANAGADSGQDSGTLRIFGIPLFSAFLKLLAILAGGLAFSRTAEGVFNLFGGGISGYPAALAGAIIVQGGLIAVSFYVASQFVRNRIKRQGPGGNESRAIAWLSMLVLAILFTLSVLFTFAGTLASSTAKQEHDNRISEATQTAIKVQQTIRATADDEMRRLTTTLKQSDSFKTWLATMRQLTVLGSQQEVPQLVARFLADNATVIANHRIELDKRKADIESALLPINRDLDVAKIRKTRIEDEIKKLDVEYVVELERLADCETRGAVCDPKDPVKWPNTRRTTGTPTCGAECQRLQGLARSERAKVTTIETQKRDVDAEIERLEKRRVAIQSGQICGPQTSPGQQPPSQRAPVRARPKGPQGDQPPLAQQPTTPPQAGQCKNLVEPANKALVDKLVANKDHVNGLTATLQANVSGIEVIYRETVLNESKATCGELKEFLLLIYKQEEQKLRGISCDPPSFGGEVGNINKIAQNIDQAKAACDKLPQAVPVPRDHAPGTPRAGRAKTDDEFLDEKKRVSLDLVERVKDYAEGCLAASRLTELGDVTKLGRDRVAAHLKDLQNNYGEGALYLNRARDQLVKGEGPALNAFSLALALDSLILILAFLSELPLVRPETSGPKPLSEMERRKLQALIRYAHGADEHGEFRAEQLLVEHLKTNAKTGNFEIDVSKVGSIDDQSLVRSLVNSQMGSGEASLAWSVGRDTYAVTQRGYFELLRGMDDVARQRQTSAPAADAPPGRTVVGPPAGTQGQPNRGSSYDYRKLFADKGAAAPGAQQEAGDDLGYLQAAGANRNGNGQPAADANGDDITRVPTYPGSDKRRS